MIIAGRTIRYLLVLAFALFAFSAHAQKRIALVIGNANYQNTPKLGNPVNDAEDVASALQRVGFTVQVERNLGKRDIEYALARFARAADGADAAMFFYAGHGIQYRGANYLMPIDARLEDDVSINFELVRVDDVMFGLERVRGVKLLVLDACRNNPLLDRLIRQSATRGVSVSRGLARVDPTGGMIVAYSTRADQVAVDGDDRNSPFTSALVKYIDEPGLEIGSLFRRVAIEVDRLTNGRQLPETWVALRGEFYLNTQETDLQAWAKIRLSDNPEQITEFMQRYPKSAIAPEAQQRLALIERIRIERERTERERLEQAAREQAERVAREAAARAQAEREQAALQKAERDQVARQQAEREQAAREQVLRDQLVHERAERERNEREQAERLERERQQAQSGNTQIAMTPPPNALSAVTEHAIGIGACSRDQGGTEARRMPHGTRRRRMADRRCASFDCQVYALCQAARGATGGDGRFSRCRAS